MAYPGGMREYMQVKQAKLAQQFRDAGGAAEGPTAVVPAATSASSLGTTSVPTTRPKRIFPNTTFYIDGYTGPNMTLHALKRALYERGARVVDWYLPGQVDFVLATSITDRKIGLWKRPIVRPAWVLESMEADRRLPYYPYLLVPVAGLAGAVDPRQGKLAFPGRLGSPASRASLHPEPSPMLHTAPFHAERVAGDAGPVVSDAEMEGQDDHENGSETEERTSGPRPPASLRAGAPLDWTNPWIRANTSIAPGFIDKYFASSRLHHISTWKAKLKGYVDGLRAARPPPSPPPATAMPAQSLLFLHVDLDCFFASVTLLEYPHLADQPVAIAHSQDREPGEGGPSTGNTSSSTTWSTSEIASCNYPARAHGIRNGMSLGRARSLYPGLHVLPYQFARYEACSRAFFAVLVQHAVGIQVVSVDEAYITMILSPGPGDVDVSRAAVRAAQELRNAIHAACHVHASVGIAHSMLLARLATRRAKPNGLHYIPAEQSAAHVGSLPVQDLPGVGYAMQAKLESLQVRTCKQLRERFALAQLQQHFGRKGGEMLHGYARGVDGRQLEDKERQSVSIEINWGVRFETWAQVRRFTEELGHKAQERFVDVWGPGPAETTRSPPLGKSKRPGAYTLTFKLKKRLYEGEPARKLLGCGHCENLSRSVPFARAQQIPGLALELLEALRMDPDFLRGIGIQLSKGASSSSSGQDRGGVLGKGQRTLDFSGRRAPPSAPMAAPATSFPAAVDLSAKGTEDSEEVFLVTSDPVSSPISESLTPGPRGDLVGAAHLPARATLVTVGGIEYDLAVLDDMWASLPPHIQLELEPLRRSAAAGTPGAAAGERSPCARLPASAPRPRDGVQGEEVAVPGQIDEEKDADVMVLSSPSTGHAMVPPPPAAARTPGPTTSAAAPDDATSFPTPSQIDPTIFEALPPSVQKEIRLVHRVKRAFRAPRFDPTGGGRSARPIASRGKGGQALPQGQAAPQPPVTPHHPIPDLAGARTLTELRVLLTTWMQSPPTPERRAQLDAFAAALIRHKDLERLIQLLRLAGRMCTSPQWADFHAILLSTIQCALREEYGWELEEFA